MEGKVGAQKRGKFKSLLIILGIFVLVQFIFIFLDGTGWEPNIRDGNLINHILSVKLFTEYFHFYSYPFFNFVTFIFLIAIILYFLTSFLLILFKRS
ncbi:YfzA family protein [Oceanobacillus sp. J11TS1]|uniref:YfzA family protein n=1 Tax=Oceanobacillus sp. J11TS1 TaxID=2807191 RepID=UPI001B11C6F5|nr:YfzA family protein [Oceanobacillus sp. J11TS1]GIO23391.1 hypothetical protein J11TS1_19720 [Oceanobacillus sp. J11TS1]